MTGTGQPVAVVTGGASGIGFALARKLGSDGMSVVVLDHNDAERADAVDALSVAGVDAIGVACDVRDADAVKSAADEVTRRLGRVDLLCANAGVSGPSDLVWESSLLDWERVYAVNVFGLVNTLRAFVPVMIDGGGGRVLVTASMTSFIADVGATIYMSSKHAVHCIADSTRQQLDAIGAPISVQLLCPGGVATRIKEHERAETERVHGSGGRPKAAVTLRANRTGNMAALDADTVAEIAVAALGSGEFYIFTHDDSRERIMPAIEPLITALQEFTPR